MKLKEKLASERRSMKKKVTLTEKVFKFVFISILPVIVTAGFIYSLIPNKVEHKFKVGDCVTYSGADYSKILSIQKDKYYASFYANGKFRLFKYDFVNNLDFYSEKFYTKVECPLVGFNWDDCIHFVTRLKSKQLKKDLNNLCYKWD